MLELQRTYNKALKKYRKWKGEMRKKDIIYHNENLENFVFKTLEELGWIKFQLDYEIVGSIDNFMYSIKPISKRNQEIKVSDQKEPLSLNRF